MRAGLMSCSVTMLAMLVLAWAPAAPAANPELPFESHWQHQGAGSCAGGGCHGSPRPLDESRVMQNEYTLWANKDAHSNAYKLLLKPEAKRIAANLGIADAAGSKECLACHSDTVGEAQKGRRYDVRDGVSCEGCHGGAQNWLALHMTSNTHAQNLAAGMYPLEDPAARVRLCLQCHLGSAGKPITHRLMGAGHPMLDFEASLFTSIEPAHFRVDKDYMERKVYSSDAKLWAIGQLVAGEAFLDGLLSERYGDQGAFPELVFYDCNACHHAPAPPRWNPGLAGPLGPGVPRLADANLVMSGVVLSVLAPEAAQAWTGALDELHRASSQSVAKTREAAKRLRDLATSAVTNLKQKEVQRKDALDLLDRLAQAGIERHAGSYTAAKQIYYASDALSTFLEKNSAGARQALKAPLDEMFAVVDVPRTYNPDAMRGALKKLRTSVQQLR